MLNFSVEMEKGTGKTYVYLRTIFALSQKYGFKNFAIVVPSVAIREGTLKNVQITADHFKGIYNNIEFEHFVYNSQTASQLRQFASSNKFQIMVINIDAFNKHANKFNQESELFSGNSPKGFVNATNPFVIIDEPQSVDNPNVVQICTLNETKPASKKRQEIGRGLRLPVNSDEMRVNPDVY